MVVVGVYAAASVWEFTTKDAVTPDEKSALVYFVAVSGKNTDATIWDGDMVVGNFGEKKIPKNVTIFPYKASPGEHYFMVNGLNWVAVRADLEANKRYIVKINNVPFINILVAEALTKAEGDEFFNHKKTTYVKFADDYRASFTKAKIIREAQDKLKESKNENMEVTLTKGHGF
jgi:hypothetical protein